MTEQLLIFILCTHKCGNMSWTHIIYRIDELNTIFIKDNGTKKRSIISKVIDLKHENWFGIKSREKDDRERVPIGLQRSFFFKWGNKELVDYLQCNLWYYWN